MAPLGRPAGVASRSSSYLRLRIRDLHRPCKLRRMARLGRHNVIEEKLVENSPPTPSTFSAVVGDVHFWVPAIVLIAGLLLLRWVS
jgi:hypothetical protein